MTRRASSPRRPPIAAAPGAPTIPSRTVPAPAVLAVLAVLALAGCEVTTGLGGFGHDLRGRYDGTFTLEWEPLSRGRGGWIDGRGSIRIDRHRGSTFSGEWAWRVDRQLFRGELEAGREEFRDEVSFFLEERFGHDVLEEVTGCFFLTGDRAFFGIASRGRLRAARTARLRCHDPFAGFRRDVLARLSFSGRR